jgi:pseudaminic acid biosynthesis-associated methylase
MIENKQQTLWKGPFGDAYARRNEAFDHQLEEQAWCKMTACLPPAKWNSVLECGSNIGRNLLTLRRLRPHLDLSLIEIHAGSYATAVDAIGPCSHFNGAIVDAPFPASSFDLVFTCGVLIHVAPRDLLDNCRRIVDWSRRYILIVEYFSTSPAEIEYRGLQHQLFKRDFGSFFLDEFPLRCLDFGFLWGRVYGGGGFDDVTFWVFEKEI